MLHGDAASETFLSEIVGAQAFPMRHMIDGVALRVRLARGAVAAAAAVPRPASAGDDLRRGDGARAPSCSGRGDAQRRARDREPRLALDQLPERRRSDRTRAHRSRRRNDRAPDRQRAQGLVHRTRQPEHAPACRRARRLRLRRRLVRRRPALLGRGRHPSSGKKPHLVVPYALDTNDMRFATAQGFDSGEAVLRATCATPSTCFTPRAIRAGSTRRRCCRSDCIAGSPAGPAGLPRWRASSITCARTTTYGLRGESTSRGTGRRRIHFGLPHDAGGA